MMFNEHLSVRLGDRDRARLDALARRVPGARPAALARDLLVAAIDAAERDPAALLRPPAPPAALDTAGPIVA
jgi:hypothetical protein